MKNKVFRFIYYLYSLYPIFIIINFVRYFGKKISPYAHIFFSKIATSARINGKCVIENSSIGEYTAISGDLLGMNTTHIRHATIGKYCSIGTNFITLPQDHIYKNVTTYSFKGNEDDIKTKRIVIENDVWIGSNVIILGGVTIGNGAVVGAGSIVTKDIPPYAIAVGNPARVIKKRFSNQMIKKLLAIRWWDSKKSISALKRSNDVKQITHLYEKIKKKNNS